VACSSEQQLPSPLEEAAEAWPQVEKLSQAQERSYDTMSLAKLPVSVSNMSWLADDVFFLATKIHFLATTDFLPSFSH
jgi:hypothetical protein